MRPPLNQFLHKSQHVKAENFLWIESSDLLEGEILNVSNEVT